MNCCLCGNSSAGTVYLDGGSWRLVRCSCGMIRTADFADQALSYAEDDYFVARNQYVQQWEKFTRIFEELFAKIIKFKTGGTFLDIGAGVGTLVAVAVAKGFAAEGVEISAWASRFAREEKRLNVRTGFLEDVSYEESSFDLIAINHVLEHVPRPTETLAEISRILKPDGVLVIGVPNIGSIMAWLKGRKWASLRPEEHLWHFTPETLKRLISQAGFEEVAFESRDNHEPQGWGLKEMAVRLINSVAIISGRSEAMLLICRKAEQ